MNVQIRVDTTEGEGYKNIGEFRPSDVEFVLSLLQEYGVIDADGAIGTVERIMYDVGFGPCINVSIDYGDK